MGFHRLPSIIGVVELIKSASRFDDRDKKSVVKITALFAWRNCITQIRSLPLLNETFLENKLINYAALDRVW